MFVHRNNSSRPYFVATLILLVTYPNKQLVVESLDQQYVGTRPSEASAIIETHPEDMAILSVTSGARSAYPLLAFGESFNLFNLFNVFRGSGSEENLLGENGNLIPLDEGQISSNFKSKPPITSKSYNFFNILKDKPEREGLETKRTNMKRFGDPSSPVIMVPGYGGSRLEARYDKPSAVRYFCDLKSEWSDIWINVKLLLPYMIDCLIDNLRLEYDYATNTTKNTAGVEIRVKNYTEISSVEYLHNLPISGFAYFAPIIDQLVRVFGYTREMNIFGAPYDFRKAPNELGTYFSQLKETSEQIFQKTGLKPITYICHSMGCNNMLYFLQRQSQDWKDIHVKRLISIAAPWGGSLSALRATALGDDLGLPYLFSESKLIKVQRSLPSTIYLFPHKQVFPDIPLIRSNIIPDLVTNPSKRNSSEKIENENKKKEKFYMAHDFKTFFEDINHPDGYRMWLNTKDLLRSIDAPGVEIWCLVGRGHKTLGRMEYMGEFPFSSNSELYDDGDGTVSVKSSQYCNNWSKEQKQPIYYKEFRAGHMEILKDEHVLEYIEGIIENETEPEKSTSLDRIF